MMKKYNHKKKVKKYKKENSVNTKLTPRKQRTDMLLKILPFNYLLTVDIILESDLRLLHPQKQYTIHIYTLKLIYKNIHLAQLNNFSTART